MRIIKFRAWDKDKQEMFEVGAMTYADEKFGIVVDDLEWNMRKDVELMQFTGLHDKNGKEIFEGDILTTTYKNRQIRMVVVTWGQWGGGTGFNIREYTSTNYKIIGNIYENPELSGRTE